MKAPAHHAGSCIQCQCRCAGINEYHTTCIGWSRLNHLMRVCSPELLATCCVQRQHPRAFGGHKDNAAHHYRGRIIEKLTYGMFPAHYTGGEKIEPPVFCCHTTCPCNSGKLFWSWAPYIPVWAASCPMVGHAFPSRLAANQEVAITMLVWGWAVEPQA